MKKNRYNIMRHLQLRRSGSIYSSREEALNFINSSDFLETLVDGEPIVASYYLDNEVYCIIGYYVSKNNATKLFTIDSKYLESKIEEVFGESITGVEINGIDASIEDNKAVISISGNSITLGSEYDGPIVKDEDDVVISPSSSDTISDSVSKVMKIIVDNERVISSSLNDLNRRIIDLSANTFTSYSNSDTISFGMTRNDDGSKNISADAKISTSVANNLLKSDDTGLYVKSSDIGNIGSVDDISKTSSANTFEVTYADTSLDSKLLQITYDTTYTGSTPEAIGGISAGVSGTELSGKTITEILDMILFPEINPTKNGTSSVSITSNGSYEVGTAFPTLTVKWNRAYYTAPNVSGNMYEYGDSTSKVAYSGSTAQSTTNLGNKVPYGSVAVHGYVAYDAGDTIYTSKGNVATKDINGTSIGTNPKASGTMTGGTATITGFYYAGANQSAIATVKKLSVKATSGMQITFNVDETTSEGLVVSDGGYKVAIPSRVWTGSTWSIYQYNGISGKYDANVTSEWELLSDTITLNDANGDAYTCKVLQHKDGQTANPSGAKYQINFS